MFAYWSGSVAGFAESDAGQIAEKVPRATLAWRTGGAQHVREHIAILRHGLGNCPADWRVLLGYPLLRLGRRIDAIIITSAAILVLCFRSRNGSAERALAEDHALDLWHFHEASRTHPVVPLLVSPQASDTVRVWPLLWHGVTPVIEASPAGLGGTLREIVSRVPSPARALTPLGWERAPYRPAVSIIEAARMLFARHTVDEITTARAELRHLLGTMASIKAAIGRARAQRRHVIVFVTGAPGSGKTLCGLHAVFGSNDRAAFLTGNLPLVHVLRAALAGDARAQGRNPRAARQQAESAIQPLLGFLRDNISRPDPPDEHVIVFDEAQRAWDAEFGSRRFGHPASEAALFLDIMGRHQDWAAIVALVGPGQEINTGEAGLAAWAEALATHPEWSAVAAPGAFDELTQGPLQAELDADLHLPASVRGLHSHMAAPWADAVLANEPGRAAKVASAASVWLTRSLAEMRAYLRRQSRGTRRAGLVCSSFAARLRAEGIWPHFPHLDSEAVAGWYLKHWPDVRASDALELPATQFAAQGLELDYVGLCWGNDLIRRHNRWVARSFSGSRWIEPKRAATIRYRINTYRVLLTRARYETVIWVPRGDPADTTRPPHEFDAITDYLLECGAQMLRAQPSQIPPSCPEPVLL